MRALAVGGGSVLLGEDGGRQGPISRSRKHLLQIISRSWLE